VWYDPRFRTRKEREQDEEDRRQIVSECTLSSLDSGRLAQHALRSGSNLAQGTLIKDVKPVVVSGVNEYIVTLSDKELGMYQWTETGAVLAEDDNDDDSEDESDEVDQPVLLRSKGKRRRLDGDEGDDDSDNAGGGQSGAGSGRGGGGGGGGGRQGSSSTGSSPFFSSQ